MGSGAVIELLQHLQQHRYLLLPDEGHVIYLFVTGLGSDVCLEEPVCLDVGWTEVVNFEDDDVDVFFDLLTDPPKTGREEVLEVLVLELCFVPGTKLLLLLLEV